MRAGDLGRVLFAASFAVLGGLLIGAHGFGDIWPTVPKWAMARDALTMLSGAVLFAGGAALLVPRAARAGALVLAGFLVLEMLVLKLPHVVAHPLIESVWLDASETLACLGGAWTIFAMLPRDGAFAHRRAGQILFGLALPAMGLSHFFYLNLTTPLIPAWLPFPVAIAYFTGAGHLAAGLGILSGVLSRLAATLEAVMVSLFTVLVWIPMLIGAPASLSNWSEFCLSAAISGAAWAVAASFRTRA